MSIPELLLLPTDPDPENNVLLSVRLAGGPAINARQVSLRHVLDIAARGHRVLTVDEYPCDLTKMTLDFAKGRARLELRLKPEIAVETNGERDDAS